MGKIEKRVMAIIKQRIAVAEKQYEETSKEMDTQHKEHVQRLERELFQDKENLCEKLVQELLKN